MERVLPCPYCNQKLSINSSVKELDCIYCKVPLIVKLTEDQGLGSNIINYSVVIATVTILLHDFDPKLEFILLASVGIYSLLNVFFDRKTLEINEPKVREEIGALWASIRPYKKFLKRELGVLDLLMQDFQLKRITGLDGLLSPLLKVHNEKIGGLTYEEQLRGIIAIKPNLDIDKLISSEIKKMEIKIDELKKYSADYSLTE